MNQGVSAQNYATGFAHLALCGATGWALHEIDFDKSPVAFGCFGFLLAHGLLGILRHTHPHVQTQVENLYRHSRLLAQIIPVALITTQLNLDDAVSVPYAYLHAATALVPTLCEIALPEQNERALDVVMLGNVGSLGYLAVMKERYWAMGLAVLSAMNHFSYRPISEHFDVPPTDLITCGLGFFTVFAVNCLSENVE